MLTAKNSGVFPLNSGLYRRAPHRHVRLGKRHQGVREGQLRAALRGAPVVLFERDQYLRYSWIFDPGGRFPKAVVGRTDIELFAPQTVRELTRLMREAMRDGQAQGTVTLTHGEVTRFMEFHVTHTSEEHDSAGGVTAVGWDVTEQHAAYSGMESALRRHRQLLRTVVHDLRSPLNSITLLASSLLREGAPERRASTAVQRLLAAARDMAHLVDGLLTATALHSNRLILERRPVRPLELVQQVVDLHGPSARAAGLTLQNTVSATLPTVDGDERRLRQVFTNLIDNALKFVSPGGTVLFSAAHQGNEIVFTVADDGPGIDQKNLSLLFEPLWQPRPDTRGVGLGLSICKEIVEAHGGRIWAESEPQAGARFFVALPCFSHAMDERSPQESLRILLVEDDVETASILSEHLKKANHEVTVAHDGESALRLACTLRPMLILCDLSLPGSMSGLELAAAIHRHRDLRQTRMVALTGWDSREDRRCTRRAGFHAHLAKPVDLEEIHRCLHRVARAPQG